MAVTVGWAERFGAMGSDGLEERLRCRAGSIRDYEALARFHYLHDRPATVTRVLVVEDVGERRVGESPLAALRSRRGTRKRARGVVGVLVESMPVLNCALREEALGCRYT
ncbi:MAG: hypothetical protein ACYTGQ_14600, partial [Planctomycetota bacterium]